ncbi:MAG: hypothetical protein II845_05740 [Oscillospiraceae bacterium]|nr:hypothetical protein [Oscillospiraceae bacterium]
MYLREISEFPAAPTFRSRPQKPLLLLREFLSRNRQIMKLSFTNYEYQDAASCRATFAKAIKYHHLEGQVAVRLSGDQVYLIRLNPKEVES